MKFFNLFVLITISLALSALAIAQSASPDSDVGPININTASEEELSAGLKNVGLEKAAAIVRHRSIHGRFKSIEDLAKVSGIGPVTIEMNRVRMTVSGAAEPNQPPTPERGREESDVATYGSPE